MLERGLVIQATLCLRQPLYSFRQQQCVERTEITIPGDASALSLRVAKDGVDADLSALYHRASKTAADFIVHECGYRQALARRPSPNL